jgi:hypothetical protein
VLVAHRVLILVIKFRFTSGEVNLKFLVFDVYQVVFCLQLLTIPESVCFNDVQIHFGDKLISSCQEQGLELGLA